MPADVSYPHVGASSASLETPSSRRLPLGIGLVVAGGASVGLWFAIAAGVRAIFF
jgi:hypothetical protein